MPDNDNRSLDILGIKPIGDSVAHVTKATVDGASSFLAKICLPAAEEFGLLLQDKVRAWRANNAVAVVQAAQERLTEQATPLHAHPRLGEESGDKNQGTDHGITTKWFPPPASYKQYMPT